jgi:glycosyltransferase involved in cell wall biosynthesis
MSRKRILYVVHRYVPYAGGSENYVRDMAEETLKRGYDVCVFTGEHKGDVNGVRVTSDVNTLNEEWNLIVVHGGDVPLQNFILQHSHIIRSPILFMLIVPSMSPTYQHAMKNVKYIGYSTEEDLQFLHSTGYIHKSVNIRHGINPEISIGQSGFKNKYNIPNDKLMLLSCGGYWPNKAMHELVDVFNKVERSDIHLVLTGYDNRHNIKPLSTSNISALMIDDRNDVMSAILEADLYIMHSHKEGFGLVLLESMLNKTPWAARNIAGAHLMRDYGFTYNTDGELIEYLKTFSKSSDDMLIRAYNHMMSNHSIKATVDDIVKLI